jgi:hypothetical protein
MKSKEFIIEDELLDLAFKMGTKYDLPPQDINFALEVKRDCQPFLQQCKAGGSDPFILYRGVNDETFTIDKTVRLTDRRPLNMDPLLHQKINAYMEDHFGHPFRNAMFCTGDIDSAEYGKTTYTVFPKGNFDFLWAIDPMYDDLYTAWHKFRNSTTQAFPNQILIQQDDIADKFLKDADYQTTNIVQAADPVESREIMVWCKEYHGIDANFEYYDKLTEIMYK